MRNKVARVSSGALTGYDGALVEVEADIKTGLPGLQIVGMGNKAIDEARQRVRSAITNSLLEFPPLKMTVNLAPAELPKDGTHLDLPIALSILVASGQLTQRDITHTFFAGELGLDGSLRPIRGAVLLAELAHRHGYTRLILPLSNAPQAQLVDGIEVTGVSTLIELYRALKGVAPFPTTTTPKTSPPLPSSPTFDDIVGHEHAKRALTIAAAGRHAVLFTGPPGSGKTLLARSLISILPPLTGSEILEVTKLYNLAYSDDNIHTAQPFRAPHHSVTQSAFIGGGLKPRPGDISLAHKGVLFLDELPEYPRTILEALRQPLEDRRVNLSRLYGHISYPADILLVATMNPCPCGYLGDEHHSCSCSAAQINSYAKRVSGPLLDRIDLRVTVSKHNHEQFFNSKPMINKQRSLVLKHVAIAREQQVARYNRSDFYNAYARLDDAKNTFRLTREAKMLLNQAATKLDISARSYLRIVRIARTIADLDPSPTIKPEHVAEALQFR